MAVADHKPSILFCLPTGLGFCNPDVATWLLGCGFELGQRHMVSKYCSYSLRSSRIMLNRNMFAEEAIKGGYDYLLMVDPDMRPDVYARRNFEGGEESLPTARPFLSVALEFLEKNPFSIIGAPACCDPPTRFVNVFRAREDGTATRVTHEEAFKEVTSDDPAVEQVAAIGTGLIMIPTRVFSALKKPYFDDEYKNEAKTDLARSQDIYFTESCSKAGIPVFVAWMCWAGHHKDVVLGCPGIDDQWANNAQRWQTNLGNSLRKKDRVPPDNGAYRTTLTKEQTSGNSVIVNPRLDIGPDASWQPPVTLQVDNDRGRVPAGQAHASSH